MTAATDQFADIARRSQDLLTDSVRGWTETVQGLGRQFTEGGLPQLPDAGLAVDRVFDLYEQVLGHQRELARTVVGAGTSVVDRFTEQATRATQSVTEQAARATETVAEEPAEGAAKASGGRTSRSGK